MKKKKKTVNINIEIHIEKKSQREISNFIEIFTK